MLLMNTVHDMNVFLLYVARMFMVLKVSCVVCDNNYFDYIKKADQKSVRFKFYASKIRNVIALSSAFPSQ